MTKKSRSTSRDYRTESVTAEKIHRGASRNAGIQNTFHALRTFEREPSTANLDALIEALAELGDRLG